ncbi:MAG: hypothetical protein AAF253_00315 [Pseudomonadota bacterium]
MLKKLIGAISVLGLMAGMAAADNQQSWPKFSESAQIQAGVGISVTSFPFTPKPSVGVLLREQTRISFDGSFTDLSPDSAYSAWWTIFNNPAKCEFGCTVPDIEMGAGQIFYAGAMLTDEQGRGRVTTALPAGRIPQGAARFSEANDFGVMIDPLSETGLRRPFGALVVLVVRNHGPINPETLTSQVGTYTGGCAQYPPEGDGEFECFDEQGILFEPIPRYSQ